jgi:biopolymer transport protein TolQ
MNQEEVISQVISTTSSQDLSIWGLISSADAVGKLVMFALVLLSIWSWAIIFDKIFKFNLIKKKIAQFDEVFWAGQGLDQLHDRLKRSIDNPLAAIFVSAMNELKRTSTTKQITDSVLKIGQKDRIMQAMLLVKNRESERIDSYLGFLAGVGAYSPFVGLFGTVWGIMHSFQSIAASKNTSLAVVAPGIAEALLATAIGLLAAIPAVAFYNYLVSQSNYIQNRMDDFIAELYTILSRSIDEEKI